MGETSWGIQVANPSPYQRSDYVEVDLNVLGVDASFGEKDLRLLPHCSERRATGGRVSNRPRLGQCDPRRPEAGVDVPLDGHSRRPRRSLPAPVVALCSGAAPQNFLTERHQARSWVGHYYEKREGNEPGDAFNATWTPGRPAYGVKLSNGAIETFFSLVPYPRQHSAIDYTGSFTSLLFHEATKATGAGEMLAPYKDAPKKCWGQILSILFFPLPWELRSRLEVSLLKKRYEVVWSNRGVMRAL